MCFAHFLVFFEAHPMTYSGSRTTYGATSNVELVGSLATWQVRLCSMGYRLAHV